MKQGKDMDGDTRMPGVTMARESEVETNGFPVEEVLRLKLKRPIVLGGATFETLEFREPTAAELRKSAVGAESAVAQTLILGQIVAGVPMRVIEQMGANDFARMSRFFGDFMTVDPEIGQS